MYEDDDFHRTNFIILQTSYEREAVSQFTFKCINIEFVNHFKMYFYVLLNLHCNTSFSRVIKQISMSVQCHTKFFDSLNYFISLE